jgi:hypothetical protein
MVEGFQAQQAEKQGVFSVSARLQQVEFAALPLSLLLEQVFSAMEHSQTSFSAASGFLTLLPLCLAETKMFTHTQ